MVPLRGLILLSMLLAAVAVVRAEEPAPTDTTPPHATLKPRPFELADVERLAQVAASRTYVNDTPSLPEELSQLSFDQYRDIRYKAEKSLWRDEALPFQVQLLHRGFLFRDRVAVNVIVKGVPAPVAYLSEMFDYGANRFAQPFAGDMGFSGIRLLYPLRKDGRFDEVTVFQGASYLRAAGLGHVWGTAARGVAIDTGLPKAEEFPVFREFWIEKPDNDSNALTVYALLDSPSVTGAYRFIIRPGLDVVMDVKAHVYLRLGVQRFGIAPLTSMFLRGKTTDRFMDDFRPEVHDSDGLLIAMRNGEWVWRPLNNPRRLRVNAFQANEALGFGLMQRDREFEHYQDLKAMYHLRPSTWVETLGNWEAGSVQLIEIPSDAEKYDNIVAFWVADRAAEPGQDRTFEYRLHFLLHSSPEPSAGGKTIATRTGASAVNVAESGERKFVVDFGGEMLRSLGSQAPVEAVVSTSSGRVSDTVVHKNVITGDWRLMFDFRPDQGQDPVDLRAYLKVGNQVLTETWINQWNAQ